MITPESANLIACWWAERITDIVKHDIGDPALEGGMATIKKELGFKEPLPISGRQTQVFINALTEIISSQQPSYLSVDYNPCEQLSTALKTAQIEPGVLPIKTVTWHGSMTCRIGNDGETQPIQLSEPNSIH